MKSGKIILMVFIVLSSAIGVVTFNELDSTKGTQIQVDDFSSEKKTVKIELSDGTGSSDTG